MESGMEYSNIDVDEMLLYIQMNRKLAGNIGRLENFLPVRAKQGGTEPGMHSNLVKGPHRMKDQSDKERQWITKVTPTNKDIIREIVGTVVSIGLQTCFANFAYEFGGEFFHQLIGGPIGARVTMAASQLVMEAILEDYKE